MENTITNIDKFIAYALNYPMEFFTITNNSGVSSEVYLPSVFRAFEKSVFNSTLNHLVSKWNYVCMETDAYGRMIKFYTYLDNKNKERMLNYIVENYQK